MAYNILVVDDSLAMRKVIAKTIRMSGIEQGEIFEAGNGYEALKLVEKNWVDLVFTDIHMPDMDGIELVKRLKSLPTCANIPVVVVSTEGRDVMVEKIRALGIAEYLTKPFKPAEVREVVHLLLEVESDVDAEDDDCDF